MIVSMPKPKTVLERGTIIYFNKVIGMRTTSQTFTPSTLVTYACYLDFWLTQ